MIGDPSKLTLSANELELVCDTGWILTKHAIIQKVTAMFGLALAQMQELTEKEKHHLPPEVFEKSPKISKGENYKMLPYVMLDYPRYFNKEKTIAIRTFFWWGNFFSICLQLSGGPKHRAMAVLQQQFLSLQQNNYWICINEDVWQHHFGAENYIPVSSISFIRFKEILAQKRFIKIVKKIPIVQWDDFNLFAEKTFLEMLGLIKINYLNDEKDLSPGTPITGSGL